MKKQFGKTYEEMFGIEKSNEIKEKAKKTRFEKGYAGIASTKEKEDERRKKISETMKRNKNAGGMRQGSGRGKKGWYKGFWCDSSYELAWVIYHIDHEINFRRNDEGFEYFYNNETHKFYPDFIKEGIYYELKGYKTKQVEAKLRQFPHKIKILYEKDLKEILSYVVEKYGKNFIELYEGVDYLNRCSICQKVIYNKSKTGRCKVCKDSFNKSNKPIPNLKLIYKKKDKNTNCLNCKCLIEKNKTGLCIKCYKQKEKFEINKTELENLIKLYSYEKIGKMFGVSGTTVKKRVKKFGIEIKHEAGFWNKISGKLIQGEKEKNVKYCNDCGEKLSYKNKSGYCQKCIGRHNCKINKNINGR